MKKMFIATIIILNFFNMNAQTTFEGLKHHSEQPYLTLNNGVRMPQFGLGLYMIAEGDEAYNAVLTALNAGYRHFDCAHAYRNERSLGRALKDSGVPRDSVWVTSKLWPNEYGEGKTLKAIDRMLNRLGLEYIDLVYFHQPVGDYVGGWKEMERDGTGHGLGKGTRHRHQQLRCQRQHFRLPHQERQNQTANHAD